MASIKYLFKYKKDRRYSYLDYPYRYSRYYDYPYYSYRSYYPYTYSRYYDRYLDLYPYRSLYYTSPLGYRTVTYV